MKTRLFSTLLTLFILTSAVFSQPGFDPPLDQPIIFPDTEIGEISTRVLTVTGRGGWWSLTFSTNRDEFSVQPEQRNVGPREAADFELIFAPQREGEVNGVLTVAVQSEGGDHFAFSTELTGTGFRGGQSEIVVEPEEIELVRNEENPVDRATINISNVGDNVLDIELIWEDVDWLHVPTRFRVAHIEPGDDRDIRISTFEHVPDNGEYETQLTIRSNDQDRPEIIVPISMTVDFPEIRLQVIELEEGWSMISTNLDFTEDFIDDEGPDMELIFEEIIDQIILIKDGNGHFCAPDFNYWGIISWERDQGYLVKTTEETELEIHGTPIPWITPIDLNAGWNTIAYFPDYRIDDLRWALDDLIERDLLIIAKDGYGRFVVPEFGFPGPPGVPGRGYMLKVTEDCRFSWAPEQGWIAQRLERDEPNELIHFPEPGQSSNNMSVLIRGINGINMVDGAEIGCFTPDGIIAGATSLYGEPSWGMAVWGDEALTEEVEGFLENETLNFVYWDPVNDREHKVNVDAIEGEPVYSSNGYLVLDIMVGIDEPDTPAPSTFAFNKICPNPFNGQTTVEYSVCGSGPVSLELYDLNGQLVFKIDDGIKHSGRYRTTIEGSDLPAGLYLVKFQADRQSFVRRLVLLK